MASFQREKLQNDILEVRRIRGRNHQKGAANKHWRRKKTTKHNNDCLNTEREKMPLRNPQGSRRNVNRPKRRKF